MPILNGQAAGWVVKGSLGIVALIIVCMTVIIGLGQPVPPEFTTIVTALISALTGLIVGSRVVTPETSAQIKTEPLTAEEVKVLEQKKEKETNEQ